MVLILVRTRRFANLEDDINLAEDYLKFCSKFVRDHCAADIAYFNKTVNTVRLQKPVAEWSGTASHTLRSRPSPRGSTT